ncbi:hypothetical protein GCM10022407_22320 [Hymenobacter antarcticus]|uniref:Uncharacterized protein n=1 Tax=Hymenobacter antarcticus TaxID=486270 RepID=A0ABP7Q591_9BACT
MHFIDLGSGLHINLGLYLILIDELSINKKQEPILSIERATIYAFLLKNPLALANVLLSLNKKVPIDIKEYEIGNIATTYPNKARYYRLKETKSMIQLLHAFGMVEIAPDVITRMPSIVVTEKGRDLSKGFKSDYFVRIREISEAVKMLHSVSIPAIRSSLNQVLDEN